MIGASFFKAYSLCQFAYPTSCKTNLQHD